MNKRRRNRKTKRALARLGFVTWGILVGFIISVFVQSATIPAVREFWFGDFLRSEFMVGILKENAPDAVTLQDVIAEVGTDSEKIKQYVIDHPEQYIYREINDDEAPAVEMPVYGEEVETCEMADLGMIYPGDWVSDDDIEYVEGWLRTLPFGVTAYLEAKGYIFILHEGSFDCDYGEAIGLHNGGERWIKIDTEDEKTIADSIIHEIGHAVTHSQTFENKLEEAGISHYEGIDFPEFANFVSHIDAGEACNRTLYTYTQEEELFATAFYEYIFYPEGLQERMPTIYRIFDETVRSFAFGGM